MTQEAHVALRPVYGENIATPRGVEAQPLPEAVFLLYQLLRERPPVANISHAKMPSMDEHVAFVRSKPYRCWWLAVDATVLIDVGAIYLTYQNEIGVAIVGRYQRKGYAEAAIRAVLAQVEPLPAIPGKRRGVFLAHVAPGNAASHGLFRKLRGRPVQLTYELPRGG